MDSSIRGRLSHIEQDLLQATSQGLPALNTLHDFWSNLFHDADQASQTNTLDSETSALLQITASRVSVLTDHLLDVQTSASDLTSAYQKDLEAIFSQVTISSESPTSPASYFSSENAESTSSQHPKDDVYPSYIEPAYTWLLNNLHNPYPPKETRNSLSHQTHSDRKVVDAWFIDARKRMGWNALRKSRFANKRVDIVDAATRFFVKPDDRRTLDSNIELEFASIEKRAKDLYCDRFSETMLAVKLDVAVKDLTPEMKARARSEERRRRQDAREEQERTARAASSYPSPERSPGRTPEPFALSPLLEDDDLATSHPEAISGRKRRSSSSHSDDDDDARDPRPDKRPRLDAISTGDVLSTGLPSPTPSSHELIDSPSPSLPDPPVPWTASRKRRLSESDGQGAPKRPRNLPVGPRMHAVSDPLPLSSALFEASRFDNWFSTNFGNLAAVQSNELDPSQSLDVEVFSYSSTANSQNHGIQLEPSIAEQPYSPLILEEPIPSLVADDPSLSADALEISTNTFDYNELFWDLEEPQTQFSGQNLVNQPHDSLLMSQIPLDYHPPSDLIFFPPADISPQAFTATVIAIPSQPYSEVPTSNFNWIFDPIVPPQDLISPVDKLQDFGQGITGQDDPFHVFGSLDSISDSLSQLLLQADKAAKQRKLQEMKEATRRLEEEIAAS